MIRNFALTFFTAMLAIGFGCDQNLAAQDGTAISEGDRQYYLAALAAAEKSLRLNQISESHRWLERAPKNLRGWEWSFLKAQLDEASITTSLDSDLITAVAASSNGKWIATADGDGKIQLRRSTDHRLIREIGDHESAVYSIAFSSDSKRLCSVSRDVTSRVWDIETGQEISRIQLDNPGVAAATFSPDGKQVATCTWFMEGEPRAVYGVVWIWDAENGKVLHRKLHGIKPLDSIAWSSDGKTIAVGSWDGLVHVLDNQGSEKRVLKFPDEGIYNAVDCVALDHDGRHVAAGSKDRTARIWNLENGQNVYTLREHGGFVNELCFSPNGKSLATACEDSILRIWNLDQPRLVPELLRGHTGSIDRMAWAPDGKILYSIARDRTLRSWDTGKSYGRRLAIQSGEDGTYSASFTPDGKRIYVATFDGEVAVFNAESGIRLESFTAHSGSTCNFLSLDQSGTRMLTCSWDKTAKLWSLPDHELIQTFAADGGVYSCKLSPNGTAAALCVGNVVQLWDTRSSKKLGDLTGHADTVAEVAFSPDGSLVASTSGDKSVRIWNPESCEEILNLAGHESGTRSVVFSDDGGQLASGDGRGTVRVWNMPDGSLNAKIKANERSITRLAFSPDGQRIAAGALGVSILDPDLEESLLTFYPLPDSVWYVAFSPDGARLATCSAGGQIAICDSNHASPEKTKHKVEPPSGN